MDLTEIFSDDTSKDRVINKDIDVSNDHFENEPNHSESKINSGNVQKILKNIGVFLRERFFVSVKSFILEFKSKFNSTETLFNEMYNSMFSLFSLLLYQLNSLINLFSNNTIRDSGNLFEFLTPLLKDYDINAFTLCFLLILNCLLFCFGRCMFFV
jgi:hypothetical protein